MTEIKIGQKWRHVKRGSTYEIVHDNASIQVSGIDGSMQRMLEAEPWIAYKHDGRGHGLFFRMKDEFLDGRFELVEDVE